MFGGRTGNSDRASARSSAPRRGWWQFSLRTLLGLMLISGMACGYLAMQIQKARMQRAAAVNVERLGGVVYYDYHESGGQLDLKATAPPSTWWRQRLGADFFDRVVAVDLRRARHVDDALLELRFFPSLRSLNASGTAATDAGMAGIRRLAQLVEIDLWGTRITDRGLESMAWLDRVERLSLGCTRVSDQGTRHLAQMSNLTELYLTETRVANQTLVHLAAVNRLERLTLFHTGIDDGGIEILGRMSRLQYLNVADSKLTAQGVERLRSMLPDCHIIW